MNTRLLGSLEVNKTDTVKLQKSISPSSTWNQNVKSKELELQDLDARYIQQPLDMTSTLMADPDLDFEFGDATSIGISDADFRTIFDNNAWAEFGELEDTMGTMQGWFSLGTTG